MAEDLDFSSFASRKNSTFTVHLDDGSVDLELIEVDRHEKPGQESFSVRFKGPKGKIPHHDTFPVEHEELGKHQLFLGPIVTGQESTDDNTQHFEAVFARLK